jgi:hypothetical protein
MVCHGSDRGFASGIRPSVDLYVLSSASFLLVFVGVVSRRPTGFPTGDPQCE